MDHHFPALISQSTLLFGTALAVSWTFRYLKAPTIIGYLITGLVIGPSSLAFIETEQVSTFAEVGLVLLLFIIGLELSPEPLMQMGRRLLMSAGLQLGVTAALAAAAAYLLLDGLPLAACLILGAAVSLSSTAITLKVLLDRREVASAMGSISTGILLLQDVFVLFLMLLLPIVATQEGESFTAGLLRSGYGMAALAVIVVVMRYLLPHILREISRHGGSELLTLFAVVMAAGGAWVAGLFGWPLALGACISGLLLAQADVRHQLVADISPFRDVFNALFFISLGMLVQLDIVMDYAWQLSLAIAATLLIKSFVTTLAVRTSGWPMRLSFQVGLGLCTVSEFGYVLASEADHLGLLGQGGQVLNLLIPYAVGTMLVGAVLVPMSGQLALKIFGGGEVEHTGGHEQRNHVIIVGYGVNGANLAKVLTSTHMPFNIVEMNPLLAQDARQFRGHVIVGDAARRSILDEAGLEHARAMVIGINDVHATRHIVAQARACRKDLYIIVRTPFAGEVEPLYQRGASMVVPADFEVSIKIFAQLLTELGIPDNVIQAQIASIRAGGYGVLRGLQTQRAEHLTELLEVFRTTSTQTFYLRDESPAANKTLGESNLRAVSGVNIIAVVRDGKAHTNPGADYIVRAGDVLVLMGTHAQLNEARTYLAGDMTRKVNV